MVFQLVFFTNIRNLLKSFIFVNRSPALVHGIFNLDQGGHRTVDIGIRIDMRANLIRRDLSAFTFQQADRYPRILHQPPAFVIIHMGMFVKDHLVARAGMHIHRNLVGHGPRRTEQGRFLAQQCCSLIFKHDHRRVIMEHIVAHPGREHGLEHLFRGTRNSIAS